MTTQLEDTGERMIPEHHKGHNIYGAHIGRYKAGMELVKNKIVLDIACGSGYGTQLMATVAEKVYGVDVDKDTIAYAKENYGADNIIYKLGNGTAIPLNDNSVDIVVSYETIEHIDDYEGFIKEVKRVLRPNGTFLLSTPNDIEYIEDNHFHLHEFTYDEIKNLVNKYFKYHKDYFQTLWLYSSILPAEMQTSEWEHPVSTINTLSLSPEQCIYFFMICSDNEISEYIKPQGVIGEHYRLRDVQAANKKTHEKHSALVKIKEETEDLLGEKNRLQQELVAIHNSKSWKLARKISHVRNSIKRKK
jgi:ubiquinone/menaquinone biosynthesis C-methylase UbiE